jgi:hypothetical protein
LLRDPFCRRVRGHIDPDKLAPSQPDNDQNVELDKADGRDHEQIHGGAAHRYAGTCPSFGPDGSLFLAMYLAFFDLIGVEP